MKCFIGIDLAVRKGKCCAIASLRDSRIAIKCSFSWEETIQCLEKLVNGCDYCIAAIDAPLSLGPSKGFRDVDRELISKGFRVLPPSFPGMRRLTEKAIELAQWLRALGCTVVETHPRSALRNSGCLNVGAALSRLGLPRVNIAGELSKWSKDLEDALVALCVAICVDRGCVEAVTASDGEIVLLSRICG